MDVVGITGTRFGASPDQLAALRAVLVALDPYMMHNGLADGVDAQAALLAQELSIDVHGHPCTLNVNRSAQRISRFVEPVLPPLDRDRNIVAASEGLIACPHTFHEVRRSGTWATVRYARKAELPIWFCWPDGRVTVDER